MKVVIIGKSGQLASELQANVPDYIEAVAVGRDEIDLTTATSVLETLSKLKPDVVINTAAYTIVDKAEIEWQAAYAINADAVAYLVAASKALNCRLLHLSTDFVFDGSKKQAYQPYDLPSPLGVYGASKLAGEQHILKAKYHNATIVRASWLYSVFGNNFVKSMLYMLRSKTELSVVTDQVSCPTSAAGLARFLWVLASVPQVDPIYHWSDLGRASKYDFAMAIQENALEMAIIDKAVPILPICSAQFPALAVRPHFSLLDASASYHLAIGKDWRDTLRNMMMHVK